MCMATQIQPSDILQKLSIPYTKLEPELSDEDLLQLDLLADELEISRLKSMGVLIPADTYAYGDEIPKRLTTRMVRTWRDKFINGVHVWLRRSRYVAREFAWLSPERQDLFSPASSVLTVRLLPTLFMKWKSLGYVLCAIDIADAFLMVPQKEPTQVTCELATGEKMDFMLGKVLPGQRNGSQMWREAFSGFLSSELQINDFPAYPSLLRSPNGECLMLLHDDVLCLSTQKYLDDVLLPALNSKYKISCEIVSKENDELTFLKRKHTLISEDEMAIQSHPKHLERLFDLLCINRRLKPKKTPGHPMLDEPDTTTKLSAGDASVYRSCIGILLYISSDYVECQYTIRGLSQSMSSPSVQAMACLRHLAQYLLGCTEHAMVLKYEAHKGLLHYNPCDYTLEIYSDSDWAKHKQTRRSVSSGYLFLFGCLLYSTSRSQKALALSSAEAEIYSAASATSDAILMYHCLRFAIGDKDDIKVHLAMDNSAARAFLCRVGVGRIRHISLRILWMQEKTKEGFMTVGKVGTKENVSDLGTKRLTRDRMEYLMNLCKVYNMANSQFVGSSFAEKLEEQQILRVGIKNLRQMGFNGTTSKSLMRVLLINALSSTMAMELPADPSPSSSSSTSGLFGMVMAFLLTIICLFCGFLVVTAHFGAALQGRLQTLRMDVALRKVLSMLKAYRREHGLDEIAEEEIPTTDEVDASEAEDRNETYQQKVERYQNSGMDEVSDDELWRMVHHGAPDEEDTAAFNRRYTDTHLENIMRETNRILATRMQRLRAEYEAAAVRNDQLSMDAIENEMTECTHLRYAI